MNNSFISRIILDVIIGIAVLNGWWFVALPCILVALWKYPYFVECIFAGVAFDALYGYVPIQGLAGYIGTLLSVIFFSASVLLKGVMRR